MALLGVGTNGASAVPMALPHAEDDAGINTRAPPLHPPCHWPPPPRPRGSGGPAAGPRCRRGPHPRGRHHAELFVASQNGNGRETVVRLLLARGAAVDRARVPYGDTPLQIATLRGHTIVVGLLQQHGAAASHADAKGTTLLHDAGASKQGNINFRPAPCEKTK